MARAPNGVKHLQSKVDWPLVVASVVPSTLMRQSTHCFSDWPFLFVQIHEILVQPFTLEMMVEQGFLHYTTGMVSQLVIHVPVGFRLPCQG